MVHSIEEKSSTNEKIIRNKQFKSASLYYTSKISDKRDGIIKWRNLN